MSDRHLVYLTDVKLITCVLQNGLAEEILEAAKNSGAQGATVSYARGTGIRDRMGLIGVTIDEQKEVVRIIVSEEQAARVFEAIYLAGKLDTPGKGIMYMSDLDHVATYIPENVLESAQQTA
ncbi:MAG: P-II family nitrogen regulator [Pseudomonadota bacterium]|nr:P-II family nitrogen regulator [Pseudomonadota bacterium]MEC8137058.1 P-II family nitrogen regulator [Pseudomonadota bacterium]MEC8372994.1 P-II family nitrogen regulator [Pseudomonadota bacterium]MEC8699797.1 P-II family nitrogen regulator [Pseudomonadota bacterium]